VCGFLEADESAEQGCSREVFEETGYEIKPEKFLQVYTQTDPETSNNGNVTLRHIAILFEHEAGPQKKSEGGEENEVEDVKWISIDNVHNYKWAFNHLQIIENLFYEYIQLD
jgi:ADP-ribose pyrophosphatase YjhB (NUDIX family)